ncbi:cation diffusion facilitator family transporter [Priestia koreensis]|uniref:Zinc transporter ZitB n=1 Tax=Priestia koreensis TaxID=284581 RepID=A0A0M0L899_9BACI|nr:cation diffusion facilitator family transporter [Priestia koreensis]KOO47072.1 zinc transporter ZitB [Priestia koreensis]
MAHSHGHGHSHGHHHGSNNKKALGFSFILIAAYMIIEVIGGIWTNSLALLSDAGHMLSDAVALGLSYMAIKFGEKKATNSKTYGYKRFEILAAFLNGIALIVIAIFIFIESYHRFTNPPDVISSGMLTISIIGLLINIATAYILMRGDKDENLNVKSAFLHVIGDMLGSIGAIVAALLIMFFNWGIADPLASVIVAILILVSGFRVTKESVHILMEGAPPGLDVDDIKKTLLALPAVSDVHDLHVWSITSDFPALSCHVVVRDQTEQASILKMVNNVLHDEYGLHHTTIQVDCSDSFCNKEDRCN